jgi:hypothetical protein
MALYLLGGVGLLVVGFILYKKFGGEKEETLEQAVELPAPAPAPAITSSRKKKRK